MSNPKRGVLENLLASDAKAELLTHFHGNPKISDTVENIAARLGKEAAELEADIQELVEIGLLREHRTYSLDPDRDASLQKEISAELERTIAEQESEPLEKVARELTGIPIIDQILPEGMPSPVMLLMMGDPGTAKREMCLEFVARTLRNERRVIYLTIDQSPEELRASLATMKDMGHPTGALARPKKMQELLIVDCYSPQIGMGSEESMNADPNNLSELSIAVSKALENRTRGILVMDSLDTLVRKSGLTSSLELLRTVRARARAAKFDSIVLLNRQEFPPAILAAVQENVDGVFEMKVQEAQAGLTRHLRVPKMRGAPHGTSWVAYELDFKTGCPAPDASNSR